ncbi:MAG: flagellar basal body-associated FliL family protein [Litorimonas sp.]
MALLKKKTGKTSAPDGAGGGAVGGPDGASDGGASKGMGKGKGGKLLGFAAPLLVFAAAFGASYFTGGAPAPAPVVEATEPDPTAATHSAEWHPSEPARTVSLEPMVLTAGPRGQTLRIGLAVEMWDESEVDMARMRDAFTTYLRALSPEQLSDPSYHVRMKRAMLHRARVVAGQDAVADVLITDFLLTS